MISVVITAGGSSSRFHGQNKLLFKIKDKPVIVHCVEVFSSLSFADEIIVSSSSLIMSELKTLFAGFDKVKIIEGGMSRQESVFNGLKACSDCEYVIIHDGARPFISKSIIENCLEKAKQYGGAIVAVKTIDTIKIVDENGFIKSTPERRTLWNAQTPQIFKYDLIYSLHQKYSGKNFTDDSLLFEEEGLKVAICEGDYSNKKITTLQDVKD